MTDSSRSYYPASGVRGGYDNYPDPHRPVSTLLSGGRRARCDPGARQDGGQFRQVRYTCRVSDEHDDDDVPRYAAEPG